ncbi:MAG: class III signal peptide-containing protein [Candidatus Micrarchaeota archaeon]
MDERAQTAVEYLLLAGAAVLVAVVAITTGRELAAAATRAAEKNATTIKAYVRSLTG